MSDWLFQLFFPAKCVFCNAILEEKEKQTYGKSKTGIEICENCFCRIPVYREDFLPCPDLAPQYFTVAVAACSYTGMVRKGMLQYKFSGRTGYYRALSKLMFAKISPLELFWDADCLAAVPMYREKERKRGYNQARLLSKGLSRLSGLPDLSGYLLKTTDTETQSLLDRVHRKQNVEGVFSVHGKNVFLEKKIILIDDIFTTGNTLNECARVLVYAGAKEVLCAVAATGKGMLK